MELNITVLIISLFSTLLTAIAFILYMNLKRSSYDQKLNRAVLESIRESHERQIYELNEKLLEDRERWKDVNHLLIRKEYTDDSIPFDLDKQPKLNEFLKANGITEKDLVIDKKLVFVLTPFHVEFDFDYHSIKRTCESVGLICIRGDEKYFSSDIFSEMLKYIVKANLIIANINGRNPNVFYELGIAQALDKPVILISKDVQNLPIDIKSKRFLIYKGSYELSELLKNELIKVLTR